LIGSVPVGIRPAALAAGASSIWVVNVEDQTISRIDPTQLTLQRTIPLTTTPTGIAFGAGAAWVANGPAGSVTRIDPGTNVVTDTVALTNDATAGFPSVGEGAVWVVFADAFLARVDPVQPRMVSSGLAGTGPAGIAAGNGAVWVANSGDNSVSRILPETATVSATITVGRHPAGIALGEGGVWVTDQGDDTVTRIDLGSGSETTIQVGGGPTGIAVGDGAVWVANSDDGTISRIDPATRRVVATIVVGNRPAGVVVAGDRVFASIQATT
jgi:YVTN family beta-propeller protein